MFTPRVALAVPVIAAVLGLAAPQVASAATPKITGYAVSGALTIWTEPQGTGCVAENPAITGTSAAPQGVPVRLYFTGLASNTWNLPTAWPGTILSTTPEEYVPYALPGPFSLNAAHMLGFGSLRSGPVTINVGSVKPKGRYTVTGLYSYRAKFGTLTYTAFKALPTKSVPYSIVAKPENSCTADMTKFFVE